MKKCQVFGNFLTVNANFPEGQINTKENRNKKQERVIRNLPITLNKTPLYENVSNKLITSDLHEMRSKNPKISKLSAPIAGKNDE